MTVSGDYVGDMFPGSLWTPWPTAASTRPAPTVTAPSPAPAMADTRASWRARAVATLMSAPTAPGTTGQGDVKFKSNNTTIDIIKFKKIPSDCISDCRSYCGSYSYCVDQPGWTAHTTYTCACHSGYDSWSQGTGESHGNVGEYIEHTSENFNTYWDGPMDLFE